MPPKKTLTSTPQQQQARTQKQLAVLARDRLAQHLTDLGAWDTLTAGQRTALSKEVMTDLVKGVRYLFNQLDAT